MLLLLVCKFRAALMRGREGTWDDKETPFSELCTQ